MLQLAIKARIPLISARTTDTLNAQAVLQHLAGRAVHRFSAESKTVEAKLVYFCHSNPPTTSIETLYSQMEGQGSTLVAVNPEKEIAGAFNVGSLPVPRELLEDRLADAGLSRDQVDDALPALGGLTLSEVAWVLRLAMARDRSVGRRALSQVRKSCFPPSRGLAQVDTDEEGYEATPDLAEWVSREAPFFLRGKRDLRPRGLLFDGPPGTGKTAGAKYIAQQIGVPCFRLELGAVKGKYVGESEQALADALGRVDREAPCVLLLDEIEKLFASRDDSGVSQNLLADVLWWLGEHETRVLAVMTTNAIGALPKELYRPGRIDAVMTFPGLELGAAREFGRRVLKRLGARVPVKKIDDAIGAQVHGTGRRCSQAAIKQAVIGTVKEHLADKARTAGTRRAARPSRPQE